MESELIVPYCDCNLLLNCVFIYYIIYVSSDNNEWQQNDNLT